jgi:electron-transferring-flavoprotein dehydrogenase
MSSEREILEMDVLLAGAGPANLACALHLTNLVAAHNERAKQSGGQQLGEIGIAVIEKAAEIGAHQLSGAVLDPATLKELIPDFEAQQAPLEAPVGEEHVYFLTGGGRISLPVIPPPLRNHGNFIVSLNRLVRWLGEKCEAAGINVFPEFPGSEMLYDGDSDRVVGVRTGDKGIDKNGKPKPNFEPGVDIRARVTVLGEGPRGSLTKQLVNRLKLDRESDPQIYSVGVKELWEVPDDRFAPGSVIHTTGWPLDPHTFGGSWVYGMRDRIIDIGHVVGLDYRDPRVDAHHEFQLFKTHPLIKDLLKGGKMIRYGAKAMPVGGWYTIPRMSAAGVLIAGDSAGLLNGERLKGIHTAIKSGMQAAEVILDALVADDFSEQKLAQYDHRVKEGPIGRELYKARNFHQAFDRGRTFGMMVEGISTITGGRLPRRLPIYAGHEHMQQQSLFDGDRYADLRYDEHLTFSKLTDVYYSGTEHSEDQPCHLKVADTNICVDRCTTEYGNPCQNFCPANVYEMVEQAEGSRRLQINFSNCVHCKTCDIMDPYQIIDWVPPEGGGGYHRRVAAGQTTETCRKLEASSGAGYPKEKQPHTKEVTMRFATLGLVLCLLPVPQLPDGKELSKQTRDAAKRFHTLQFAIVVTVETSGEHPMKIQSEGSMVMVNPGKMRIESSAQGMTQLTVSDGETTWVCLSNKEYTKIPAATGPAGVMETIGIKLPDLSRMQENAKTLREETIDIDGQKHDCWVVESRVAEMSLPAPQNVKTEIKMVDFVATSWIDKKLLVDFQSTASVKVEMSGMPGFELQEKTVKKNVKIDEPIADSLFTFIPPAGAKEVKEFTLIGSASAGATLTGKEAPAFEVQGLDASPYSLSALKGRPVLLDFWATWCSPCRKSMPILERLNEEYKDQGLVILGVDVGEEREAVEAFLKKSPSAYPTVLSGESGILSAYQVGAYPTFVLIGRDGKVAAQQVGFGGEAALRGMLDKAGLKPPAKSK